MIGSKSWIRRDPGIDTFEKAIEMANLINENCKWKKKNTAWTWNRYAQKLGIQDTEKATQQFFDKIYYPNLLRAIDEL